MANSNPPNPFQEGNQAALQHGAAGALKRFLQGQEFIGYALEVQREVEAELGLDLDSFAGLERQRIERYCGIHATARMYHDAALSSAAEGDVEAWAKRKRWALYASDKASKEQDKVEDMLAKRGDVVVLDAIKAASDD
jgi:hypothetical protein